MSGLTDTMKRAVFENTAGSETYKTGDMCLVKVRDATQNTLLCEPIGRMTISDYYRTFNGDRRAPYRHQELA